MKELALQTPGGNLQSVQGMPSSGFGDLQSVIQWGTTVLMIGAVILALFFLIWGGIQWITSRGNKENLAAAQKRIIYAVIGLVIALSAFMIINIVSGLLGVNFFG